MTEEEINKVLKELKELKEKKHARKILSGEKRRLTNLSPKKFDEEEVEEDIKEKREELKELKKEYWRENR